jgi:hypothetical protein
MEEEPLKSAKVDLFFLERSTSMNIECWNSFITYISNEVLWDDEFAFNENSLKLENALREIAKYPFSIQQRGEEILNDPHIFNSYVQHCNYPRTIMDKFMLYMDERDRFRVRIHRFKTKIQNGSSVDRPHSHKWPMATIILKGSYIEKLYKIEEIDIQSKRAKISEFSSRLLTTGDTNSLNYDVVHQTVCNSDEPAITLFIRGKSFKSTARIFPIGENRFYETYSPEQQLRIGYEYITKLDPFFH